ncbi:MAG: RNA polymerase sigma-70 factor [Bacteroidetes bacterium]|nr:RNA polymerase sigma-70 factor [Bacteroidota bacterium]
MAANNITDEQVLISRMKKGDKAAFRSLFDSYYKYLLVTAYNILGDSEKAKDLAQDVFADLWNKRAQLKINFSLKAYLRRAVINKTLNYIKAQRMDFLEPSKLPEQSTVSNNPQENLEAEDLKKIINDSIDKLPKRCRTIFTLCRLENMSHKEIAEQLNISTKTVENQMTKALKILRRAIAPYLKAKD